MGFALTAFADKHEHRHHEAHVHGGGTLSIAFDNFKGRIELKAASAGIVGFEHVAKSEKDKKALVEVTEKITKEISSMVKFDAKLECSIAKDKVEMNHDGDHSDFIANFNVECKKSLLDSKLTLDFTSFKKIKDLDTTILVGDLQKTVELKQKPVTIDLK
jgi:hypothetical protein